MSAELFELPQCLSPRLVWRDKHRLRGQKVSATEYAAWTGPAEWADVVARGGGELIGKGSSQEDADADWAVRNNVRLWNEEKGFV